MMRAGGLVRVIRRGTGSVVTWRRAQMVLLSAQGIDVAAIAVRTTRRYRTVEIQAGAHTNTAEQP